MRRLVPPRAWLRDCPRPRVGIDVVSLDRIRRAGEPEVRRLVCDEPERAALDQLGGRPGLQVTAATWAVKEAAVKAAGGRPAGFRWPSVRVEHYPAGGGQLAGFLGGAILDVTGDRPCGWCRYQWRLPVPEAAGTAVWGMADGAVWVIALAAGAGVCAGRPDEGG
jgi:hypothetical protein